MRLMSRGNNVKRCYTSCKSAIKMPSLLLLLCVTELFINWPHDMDTLVMEMLLKMLTARVLSDQGGPVIWINL